MSLAPILITVGPQCAGKTTYLSMMSSALPLIDVAIDDDPSVYIEVPIQSLWQSLHTEISEDSESYRDYLGHVEYGQTIEERFLSQSNLELRLIFELFAARGFEHSTDQSPTTLESASMQLRHLLRDRSEASILISVLHEIYPTSDLTTPSIALFVPEAIPVAVSRSLQRLADLIFPSSGMPEDQRHILSQTCICWGNTNLNPQYYKEVLKMAAESGRPVRFIRWTRELPAISFRELVKRNILRFLQTGKYIPVLTLQRCLESANQLVYNSGGPQNCNHSHFILGTGYTMDSCGHVSGENKFAGPHYGINVESERLKKRDCHQQNQTAPTLTKESLPLPSSSVEIIPQNIVRQDESNPLNPCNKIVETEPALETTSCSSSLIKAVDSAESVVAEISAYEADIVEQPTIVSVESHSDVYSSEKFRSIWTSWLDHNDVMF